MTEKSKIIPFPHPNITPTESVDKSTHDSKRELVRLTFDQLRLYVTGERRRIPDLSGCGAPEILALREQCDELLPSCTAVQTERLHAAIYTLNNLLYIQLNLPLEVPVPPPASKIIVLHS